MPVTVERVPKQPVVIAKLTGHLTVQDVLQMYNDSAQLLADVSANDHKYRITDVGRMESSFAEMVAILAEARKHSSFRTTDPNITAILVGENNEWVKLVRESLKQPQYGGVDLALVGSREEAWDLIHADQKQRQGSR